MNGGPASPETRIAYAHFAGNGDTALGEEALRLARVLAVAKAEDLHGHDAGSMGAMSRCGYCRAVGIDDSFITVLS